MSDTFTTNTSAASASTVYVTGDFVTGTTQTASTRTPPPNDTRTAVAAGERPPRDNLFRAVTEAPQLASSRGSLRQMTGHFTPFNQWTEIDSVYEGRFLERIAPGAFARTFKNNGSNIRTLFQHGRDPQVGNKPLGPIVELEEDDYGARYVVDLLDTSYNRDLLPGLEAGLYGASFRFRALKEDFNDRADKSSYNPDGIPERTITEAQVMEFGPVTFPAYAGATAGVRSMSDEFIFEQFISSDRLKQLVEFIPHIDRDSAEATPIESAKSEADVPALRDSPAEKHAASQTRTGNATRTPLYGSKEKPTWLL